jgi:predicted heme/steroid binding protein/uncharacterized membrane protein
MRKAHLMKEFDENTLKENNGDNGKPVYVAHKGKVYDVSRSKLWKTGKHMNRHHAGNDMTTDIQAAPHTPEVLERFPQVGILKAGTEERKIPAFLSALLTRVPMLRRHPHPMTIHFPIVFVFSVLFFNVAYILTGIKSFEVTAFHCLGAGILFTPVAIVTGFYTWWLNYNAKITTPVLVKQICSTLLLIVEIILFIMRFKNPEILYSFSGCTILFSALLFFMVILVTVVGWYGAHLTFPVEKE